MSSRNLFFNSITLRNFMSYGNAPVTIDLNQKGTVQIQGRNLDDTQQGIGANGVGKSSIIIAIVYAMYGEAIGTDVKIDDIVNDINGKECVVSVDFNLDGDRYQITRYRKMKSGPEGNYIEIFKNGNNDTKFNLAKATIPETNSWIEHELIDMPKELFTRLVVYDADELSFFKLPAQKQRDLMENLFQLTILSEKANIIKDQQKDTKGVLDVEEVSIESYKVQIDKHTKQIDKAKSRVEEWEAQRKTDLDNYRSDFIELSQVDVDEQRIILKSIEDAEKQVLQINVDISKRDVDQQHHKKLLDGILEKTNLQINNIRSSFTAKRQELRAKILGLQSDITEEQTRLDAQRSYAVGIAKEAKQKQDIINNLQTQIEDFEQKIKQQQGEIATLNKNECPECHQQMPDATKNIKTRETIISEVKIAIHDTNKTIDDHEKLRNELINQSEQQNETYQTMLTNSRCSELKTEVTKLSADIDSLSKDEEHSIVSCNKSHQDEINEIQNLIEICNNDIINLKSKQSEIRASVPRDLLVIRDETQLIRLESEKENLEKQIKDMDELINPHLDAMQELLDSEPKAFDYTNINNYKKLIDHQQFLIKVLTDKRSFIRKKLISKRLPYLNERLSVYLKAMGLPYRVEFNSDLTPSIAKRGREKSFGVLSHGQKARVNFALSFAFRDVLERMHRKINICLLDEVLDKALCPVGANSAVTLINEKARDDKITIFVITHKADLATRFNKQMVVTLQNGFSSVQIQTMPSQN